MKEPECKRGAPAVSASLLACIFLFSSLSFSAAAQGEGDSWHVPLEPQTGLLNSEDPADRKYIKEVIWIDEPALGMAEAADPSAITVDSLRLSLGDALGKALAKNELASGVQVQAMGERSATPASAPGQVTLSRDVIPILLQSYSKAGRRVTAMSGPSSHPEPSLRMEDLLRQKQMEQSAAFQRDQISYASASSTASFHNSRPSFAFDGDPATVWMSQPWNKTATGEGARQPAQWLEYSFEEPQILAGYSLSAFPALAAGQVPTNENSLARLGGAVFGGPTAWSLKCSDAGVIWVDVHSVRKSQPWIPGETRSFPISNLTPWNYCRVYIHQVPQRPDGQMQAALSEVTFSTASTATAASIGTPEEAMPLPGRGRETTASGRYTATAGEDRLRTPLPVGWTLERERETCAFPFKHNGILQHRCIPFQERFWCKTEANNWLICQGGSGNSGEGVGFQSPRTGVPMQEASSQSVGPLPSIGVPEFARYEEQEVIVARQCKFPFLYYGSLHNECLSFGAKSWCKDHRDRWLTCGGSAEKSVFENYGVLGTGGDHDLAAPTNTDWYLPLADLAVGDIGGDSLNVLEMRPHRNSNADTIEYNICKVSGHSEYNLYIPPQYTALPTGDDDAAHVQLPDDFSFPFYGEEFSDMFVGSNGYITFEAADMNYLPSEQSHRSKKRISVMFTDVDPTESGGEVQFADLNSAVAVTWRNVTLRQPDDHSKIPNQTFQTILFKDGTIWMGFESALQPESGAIIGLSSGAAERTQQQGKPRIQVTRNLDSIQEC